MSQEAFIFSFLEHLTEHFNKQNMVFRILEPLLDPEMEKEQQTVLAINQIEVGELHLLFNSIFDETSLVYYSPSGLMELYLLDFHEYESYKLSDYMLLLNEFGALIYGEKLLYDRFRQPLS